MSDAATVEGTSLTVLSVADLPTVLAADKDDILGKLVRELEGFEPDVTTPKGRTEIASKAHKVARAKMDLVRLAGTLKEDAQKTIKGVNAEVKIIEQRMDALRDSVRKPLDDFEAAEEARVKGHEAALAEIEALFISLPAEASAADIAGRIETLKAWPARDWQEFAARAEKEVNSTMHCLTRAHARALEEIAQAAEAARLAAEEAERRREEETRLRAEREAQIAAEAAERARQEAERKAAEEAAEAERRAREERNRIEAEKRRAQEAAERAEQERIAAERRAAELERARVQRHRDLIAGIPEDPAWEPTESSADIQRRLVYLRQVDVTKFEEFADDARAAIATEIERAEGFLATALAREEAAALAKAEAERVAREEQAERDRQAAAAAERQRIADEQAAQQREAEERERNVAHKRKVDRVAAAAMVKAMAEAHSGNKEEAAQIAASIVAAIANGDVPGVRIFY